MLWTLVWLWGCGEKTVDTAEATIVLPHAQSDGFCEKAEVSGQVVGSMDCANELCTIEGGEFWMGSTETAAECPMHEVTLSEFRMDQFEVTLRDWQNCVTQGRCTALPTHCLNELINRPDYSVDFPAVCVTWTQAKTYCQGIGGRLPTEAEWEKAAAGLEAAKWAWGSLAADCSRANFRLASIYCAPGVKPVGTYSQSESAYGLYDMNGNVFEWVADWYDARFYETSDEMDPLKSEGNCRMTTDGEPKSCEHRVLRGGAYNTTEATIRNAARSSASPDLVDVNIGFRCAYDVQ